MKLLKMIVRKERVDAVVRALREGQVDRLLIVAGRVDELIEAVRHCRDPACRPKLTAS